MRKLTRGRVVPIISASVSWEISLRAILRAVQVVMTRAVERRNGLKAKQSAIAQTAHSNPSSVRDTLCDLHSRRDRDAAQR